MKNRLLYVTHRVPWPPDRGDRIRTWNVLKFLAARADIDLLALSDEPVSDETRAVLERVTKRCMIVSHQGCRRYLRGILSLAAGRSATEGIFHSPEAVRILRGWAAETAWDAAIVSSSGVAHYTAPEVLQQRTRRWIDLIDVDSQKWFDYSAAAGIPASMLYALEGRRLRRTECLLAEQSERLLVVSTAEERIFRSFCATDRLMTVSNGVDTDYFSPNFGQNLPASPPVCVFVGVMNYLPNVDAVCWFVRHVWSGIRERHPEAVFRIVGRSPAAEVRQLADVSGVEVIGSVDDVRPWIHQAHCMVVPLRIARGIQNKVLEGLACGQAVICSPTPLQGLAAEPGLHLLRADTPAEWVQAVGRVFDDAELRRELGIAGSLWVTQQHGWEACLEPLNELTQPVKAFSSSTMVPDATLLREMTEAT